MRSRLLLPLVSMLAATPAVAIEPERREVTVTHNRVWDGHAYKENFVPSKVDELYLLPNVDNAVNFVRTQEYYWPLSRQTYVAFEKQHEEIEGTLVIRNSNGVVAEVPRQPFSIHYPNGAVNGDGELLWGARAEEAHARFREEERAFVRELSSLRQAHTAYERALRDAAIARIRGEGVQDVPPPPQRPEPLLKLVTEPQPAFRVALPAGRYEAVLVSDGEEVQGTHKTFHVIANAASDVTVLDIVPEERWTRPIQSNLAEDRIYVRPGAQFFVTAHAASRFEKIDYVRLVRPQASAPQGRRIWVRRKPAEADTMKVRWGGEGGVDDVPLAGLKVTQTQGSSFGYVVRQAGPEEIADLAAFTVDAPEGLLTRGGSISIGEGGRTVSRDVIVVQPRHAGFTWFLAFVPAAFGLALAWLRRPRRG